MIWYELRDGEYLECPRALTIVMCVLVPNFSIAQFWYLFAHNTDEINLGLFFKINSITDVFFTDNLISKRNL